MRKLGKLGLAGLVLLAGCGVNQVIPEDITLSGSHKFLLHGRKPWPNKWEWERLEHILAQERKEAGRKIESYLDPILRKTDPKGQEIRFYPDQMNHVNMFVTKTNKQRVILHQLSRFDHAKECKDGFLEGGMVTLETSYNSQTRWHVLNILDLTSIQRQQDSTVATLKNGQELRGRWIGNQEISDFYKRRREKSRARSSSEEYSQVPAAELMGISGNRYVRIPVKDIQEIVFDTAGAKVKQGKSTPRKIQLRDGTIFTAQNSFVLDYYGFNSDSYSYCGTWRHWHNNVRRRLEDNNIDAGPLETFTQLEFTGRFVPEDSQNREVIYTLAGGARKTKVLEMHHEKPVIRTAVPSGPPPLFGHSTPPYPSGHSFTHTSKPNSHRTGSDFDKFYIERPWGATIVPLDDVRKITVISEKELQEIPQPFTD